MTVAKAESFQVPAIVAEVGPEATKKFFEFFTVPIRNKNTRIAYYHAIGQFLDWCGRAGFQSLEDIEPITVAAYIEQHPGSPPTVKQHMAAIRMLFSWLTEKGILAMNPAREGKTQKFSRLEGKTPAPPHRGKRSLIRFREKGGKEKEIPVHHKLEEYLDAYLQAAKLSEQPASPLFRSTRGRSRELGTDGLSRKDAWAMLKRRLRDAGLSTLYSNHSFRAAGITNYLENDGTLEVAQRIAGHADSRTTKLYDRRGQKVLLEDMERIRY